MGLIHIVRFAALAAIAVGVSGCSAAPAPSATPTTGGPDPTPSASVEVPADPVAAFRAIADASCNKANAEGVVETTVDGSAFSILLPKSDAYKDFTAVAVSADDGRSLIWSTEDFAVCNASVGFAMAEDSGGDYDLNVVFDVSDGSYSTTYDTGQDYVIEARYVVDDGVFSRVDLGPSDNVTEMTITYGMPTDEHIAELHAAVDEFLAEE